MTLMAVIIGTANNMPQIPHTQLQKEQTGEDGDLIHR